MAAEEEDSPQAKIPPLRARVMAAKVMERKVKAEVAEVAEAAAEASDGAQRSAGRSRRRTDGLQLQDRVGQAQDLLGSYVGAQSPATLLL